MTARAKPEEFYILSLKYSKGDNIVWWGPDDGGYTVVLDRAGKYSREQVEGHRSYYDDREDTLAVPCEIAEARTVRIVTTAWLQAVIDESLALYPRGENR